MNEVYESILSGLTEIVEDVKHSETKLSRRVATIVPVKEYTAVEIQTIRKNAGFSQRMLAYYMGVSVKTVEAWESGRNHPSGAASRILNMMEMDRELTRKYPFVINL